jgi:16S rRNA (guanine(527)-N(7))-methyltransferase RsmG
MNNDKKINVNSAAVIPTEQQFALEIEKSGLLFTSEQIKRASKFASLMHSENQSQNLTRILGSKDFVDGHLLDVHQLFHVEQSLGWILGPIVADVGCGSGVPGLLAAAIDIAPTRRWLLVESEVKKADYLKRTADELQLSSVGVIPKRAEEILKHAKVDTFVARAVGTVDKIASWIWECSTWNNLILFKSRGWEDEWKEASKSKYGKKLTVTATHEYSSGDKYRILVNLQKK